MASRRDASFGRRREPHTVIIARGKKVRHFTVRPWLVAFAGSALAALAISYLTATTYLVLRDDLLGATAARQARMQQAYEDRISMLRAQVDRITSRQILDQQMVEGKVAELLARQSRLTQRHGKISPIIDRARGAEGVLPESAPVPSGRPALRASLTPQSVAGVFSRLTGEPAQPVTVDSPAQNAFWSQAQGRLVDQAPESVSRHLFEQLDQSLSAIEKEQIVGLRSLADETYQTADAISQALKSAGLKVDAGFGEEGVGGPMMPVDHESLFDDHVRELDEAIQRLEAIKDQARAMPIFNPAPGQRISSSFGVRRDPFLRRPAMHAGMDFRAPSGTPILSAGAGRVVRAGWAGGYGRLVEVDHGNGWTTRYAHMSRIDVSRGQQVAAGDRLGAVGSTGRSTGPHLHYEVRNRGKPVDPLAFVRAGREIGDLL